MEEKRFQDILRNLSKRSLEREEIFMYLIAQLMVSRGLWKEIKREGEVILYQDGESMETYRVKDPGLTPTQEFLAAQEFARIAKKGV
jgi:hypothetical protein